MRCLCIGALVASAWTGVAQAQPLSTDWRCEVVYSPARQVWVRTVRLQYDAQRLLQVAVDGVPVYSFSVSGNVVSTAFDNERVRFDVGQRTWRSDFRGQALGEGRCEPTGP